MRVEVDVFSGRPNPVWDLSREEQNAFLALFGALPAARNETSLGGLGYRGLIVTTLGGEFGNSDQITVFDGIVHSSSPANEQSLLDQNRHLEQWLLNTGKDRLDSDLFEMVRRQIAP